MSKMANPMEALHKFQQHLNVAPIDPSDLEDGYLKLHDCVPSGKRFSCVKIVDGEVQALAIFGEEYPYRGVERFSVGYAVSENHRRRGLAVEAVNRGIEELKKEVSRANKKSFYVEALIDVTNTNSIGVAKKLFLGTGTPKEDDETGNPALLFYKQIILP